MDSIRLASILLLASKIELLSIDLNSWMSSNRLSLNSAKTQLIWFVTPQQLLKLDHALLSDRFPHFTFHTTVRDLGVTLDSALTFSQHISNLTRSSYFQLKRLRTICKAVSVPIFTSIVHAFVCSRIDYCNSLLIGSSGITTGAGTDKRIGKAFRNLLCGARPYVSTVW